MSKKKKNIPVFFIFLCKKFWENNFQKINYQFEISRETIILDISTFTWYNYVPRPKRKKILVFFIFLCKKFWEKNFQKIKYQLEISSKNDNYRYKYFLKIKLGTKSEKK